MYKFILGLVCLFLALVLLWQAVGVSRARDYVAVYFLDVGQGDAILVRTTDDHWALIDGGRGSKVLEELAAVLPLWERHIDVVIASHPDADHIQGLIPVLERYSVGKFIYEPAPPAAQSSISTNLNAVSQKWEIARQVVQAGDKFNLGCCVEISVVWPDTFKPNEKYVSNDRSIALVMSIGSTDIWLGGDLSAPFEEQAVKRLENRSVEVLKVGHHGSRTSSSAKFLSMLRPQLGVISVGRNNSYGHPHPEVLDNLAAAQVTIMSTAQCGRVYLEVRQTEYRATSKCGVEYFVSEI